MHFDFLICSERAGSNLITKMIDAHPQVCGPFPTQIIKNITPHLFRYGDLQNDDNFTTLLQDVVDYLNAMHSDWQHYPTVEELQTHVHDRNFGAIVRYCYEQEALANKKQRLFVKDNHAYKSIGFMEAHFDSPRYVYLVRDPRDVAYTWKNSILAGGIDNAAQTWQRDQAESLAVYGYLQAVDRAILVRFEDLLRDAETELRNVCRLLELEYAPAMLDFHKKDIVQKNASHMSAWKDLGSPLNTNNFGLYKEGLSEIEIRYVEAVCGNEMTYFGYEREYEPSQSAEELFKQIPDNTAVSDQMTPHEREVFQRWANVKQRIANRRLY